ncbi:threonine-phosphate decarboxylase CobD [Thermosynechococcus sp. JY1334]|uniref:threonine-phosphate decarboxylase CobD n=1 Tax=unclassified Thermosynechococcus TaxID=2622553 RepID=UPI00267226DB|nr:MULTISPECIES: threonine-phosphate decarboxylase CobD [unclassified Thermosynechococcus]MDR7898078.1 threonine-phosphate decarboxylase CobD [Thermosynechococcus sp. JY1332]MDR7905479.1 threonine-phosphate decarboxylase CobD [Thermosynechococcus sp. JY1334]WKT85209.1 threonine-phosphate decarboxylase CobD [Thermosynechococcus sp. JY1339]WNC54151.1 threonine-phosphate decarboxylase CobD [Thermosynechococcus sp. JY1331]
MPPRHGGNLAWAAAIAGCAPDEILDFSASLNPWGPPDSVIAALQTALPTIRNYPDPDCRPLGDAIATLHQLPRDYFLVGNGAAELLTWVGRECSDRRQIYLVTPAFADYRRALASFACPIVPIPLAQVQSDFGAIAPSLTPEDAILINNPHNPSGQLWSRNQLQPLLETGALVIVDEAFMDFLPPAASESLVGVVPQYSNLIVLRSLTKFYSLAGLRLGYGVSSPERWQRWRSWRDPWSVNSLAIIAGVTALGDRPFQENTWQWLPPARHAFAAALNTMPELKVVTESKANFLLIKATDAILPLQTYLLQQHRILIRDCCSFPELGASYFRVAVRRDSENQRLLEGLRAYYQRR